MPLGKDIDEMLSGYLDGQLTQEELRAVEAALQEDSRLSARYAEFAAISSELHALASHPSRGLPSNFKEHVLARCAELSSAAGGVLPHESDEGTADAFPSSSGAISVAVADALAVADHNGRPTKSQRLLKIASALAALATVLVLAVWLPTWQSSSIQPLVDHSIERDADTPGLGADNGGLATAEGSRSTEDSEAVLDSSSPGAGRMASDRSGVSQISYALVLDLELSKRAVEQNVLNSLLAKYGISLLQGVPLNAEIEKAVDRMRFTVKENQQFKPAQLYLVRAPSAILDAAIAEIESEIELFPEYRFDLAFQTPTVSISQVIADALSQQIAVNNSYAVPVVLGQPAQGDADGENPSSFESLPYQGTLISSTRRRERFDSAIEEIPDGDMSFLLILARQP